MKLTIIGSGSCVPNPERNSSGALLEVDGKLILIDCGTGILHNIPKTGYDYKNIDIICITHLHLDHINDFSALLFAYRNDPDCNRTKNLKIIAPIGFMDYYKSIQKTYGDSIKPNGYKIIIREAESSTKNIDRLRIKIISTYHTENSIGFRFEYIDKVLSVSGDTGYHKNIITLCKEADLAVLECSFPEEANADYHLNPSTAGKIAEQARIKKLILTHIYPVTEKYPIIPRCRKYFSGEVEIAENLKTYLI